jgi:hypothetical protein
MLCDAVMGAKNGSQRNCKGSQLTTSVVRVVGAAWARVDSSRALPALMRMGTLQAIRPDRQCGS